MYLSLLLISINLGISSLVCDSQEKVPVTGLSQLSWLALKNRLSLNYVLRLVF